MEKYSFIREKYHTNRQKKMGIYAKQKKMGIYAKKKVRKREPL